MLGRSIHPTLFLSSTGAKRTLYVGLQYQLRRHVIHAFSAGENVRSTSRTLATFAIEKEDIKPKPNLLQLAGRIQTITNQIASDLNTEGIPEPTFETNANTLPETEKFTKSCALLNDATRDLLRLVNGPRNDAWNLVCTLYDMVAWQVACEFDIFEAVPEVGEASLADISAETNVDEDRLGRLLRLLATDRVFEEVRPGVFRHTSRSVLCLRDRQMRDVVHYQLDEFFKAASETATSVASSPRMTDGAYNPFVSRHGVPLFQFYQNDRQKAGRFASAMAGVSKMERMFEELVQSYRWEDIKGGKIIDIGGGNGHVSISLAREIFPNLEFVVQDSIAMITQGKNQDLSDLKGRVSFMEHNFLAPQPIVGAAAYLLRHVTHNWSDEVCINIFRALVPALERSDPKTPFFINDIVMPDSRSPTYYRERRLRQVDVMMMVVLGAKQRTRTEFQRLLTAADSRYCIKEVHGKGELGLIEVLLDIER